MFINPVYCIILFNVITHWTAGSSFQSEVMGIFHYITMTRTFLSLTQSFISWRMGYFWVKNCPQLIADYSPWCTKSGMHSFTSRSAICLHGMVLRPRSNFINKWVQLNSKQQRKWNINHCKVDLLHFTSVKFFVVGSLPLVNVEVDQLHHLDACRTVLIQLFVLMCCCWIA
jgi:hypothetical protein